MRRTYQEELAYLEQIDSCRWRIKSDFVPNMRVPGLFFVNGALKPLLFEELKLHSERGAHGGFLPAMKQIGNYLGSNPISFILLNY